MYQDEFSIILPSNSSEKYFPNNTTTKFSTRLPREVELNGNWLVGISEIHIPCTTLHIPKEAANIAAETDNEPYYFRHGLYDSLHTLVQSINDTLFKYYNNQVCAKLFYNEKGGYVVSRDFKPDEERKKICKVPVLRGITARVLGYESFSQFPVPDDEKKYEGEQMLIGDRPASLTRGVPDQLFVYSNICEHSIVGDTHAPLLRIVSIEASNYNFGSIIVKTYAPIHYVPLLRNRFQVVDIDIRDQFGEPIAFEFGTLTVTLRFKKVY